MDSRFRVTVLTLFPELMERYFATSIMGRAITSGIVDARVVNIRDYAVDKHRTCDDAPYGGGAGMVLMAPPLAAAIDAHRTDNTHVVFPTPSGVRFTQAAARRLAQRDELLLICGRYEGIDQRVIDEYVDAEFSIGDYVLSSGEVAAMVIIEATYRLIQGVIRSESHGDESFSNGLLEYPHFTRPEVFRSRRVPEVLRSGNHAAIEAWRHKQRLAKTLRNRPDLLDYSALSADDIDYLNRLQKGEESDYE